MSELAPLDAPACRSHHRSLAARIVIAFALLASVVACSGADDSSADGNGANEEDGVVAESTEDALTSAGPCAGRPIARAVRCAQAKGARVLSFYRSPAEQERVRRENHCRTRRPRRPGGKISGDNPDHPRPTLTGGKAKTGKSAG
jgi:hypothetical protein